MACAFRMGCEMTLYHGSNVEVSVPKLMPRVRALDFGRAFYLTTDFEQASLLPQRLKDQFALKTEVALANLTFLEGRHV